MQFVVLENGQVLRIIEYTVCRKEPNGDRTKIINVHTFNDAMERLKTEGRNHMERLVQDEPNTTAITHVYDKTNNTWFDENHMPLQEKTEPTDDAPVRLNQAVPTTNCVMTVSARHLTKNTMTIIRNQNQEHVFPEPASMHTRRGFFISTRQIERDTPNDLVKVLRYASKKNAQLVFITDESLPVTDLPLLTPDTQETVRLDSIGPTLKNAIEAACLDRGAFPSKIEIEYNSGKKESRTAFDIFDVYSIDQLPAVWLNHCRKNNIAKPDSIVSITRLCRI